MLKPKSLSYSILIWKYWLIFFARIKVFQVKVPGLHPLKTSENLWIFSVFEKYITGTLTWNWVKGGSPRDNKAILDTNLQTKLSIKVTNVLDVFKVVKLTHEAANRLSSSADWLGSSVFIAHFEQCQHISFVFLFLPFSKCLFDVRYLSSSLLEIWYQIRGPYPSLDDLLLNTT